MFPHSAIINITQNVNIFVKTKNAQEALKHKINLNFFLHGCSHKGEAGGLSQSGNFSHVLPFLVLTISLRDANIFWSPTKQRNVLAASKFDSEHFSDDKLFSHSRVSQFVGPGFPIVF